MQVQVSKRHKMVGVTPSPEVSNLFPDAKAMDFGGTRLTLLPHGLTETYLLRKLGYQVPSPILTHYQWSGPEQPFDAQRKTCALMTMNERCYVLNGKGTGKTRTALWAWDYLRGNNFSNKMLVIAPLSTLKFTWAHECIRTLPHRKYAVLHGSKSKRLALLADPEIEVFFINHDGIKVIFDELMHHKEIDTLCIDELAVYRNSSDRTKAARKLAKKMKFVWGMTGDPMPHEVTDVWGQCTVVTPHTVPERFNRFRDDLMYRPNANALFTWVPRVDAVERAYACMQPAVRFSLDDVQELPDLVERWVDVEISPKQLKAYEDIRKHCVALIGANQITAVNAGVALNKLLQVSAGWVYTSDGQIVPLDNDVRQQTMLDDINGAANKVLVFA
ncbi:MAG: SNF2-related protein, partial [Ktedonobacterales bacterium]